MKEELEQKLFDKYPKLFELKESRESCMCYGITCGDGWYNILETLCRKLDSYNEKKSKQDAEYEPVKFDQIKEKFGQLRIYTLGGDITTYSLISFADTLSGITCESCGSPGKMRTKGWWSVRCENCESEYKKVKGIPEDEKDDDEDEED